MYLQFYGWRHVSQNGPYDMWHWQYLRERCAGANSYKFPTYLLAFAMLLSSYTGLLASTKCGLGRCLVACSVRHKSRGRSLLSTVDLLRVFEWHSGMLRASNDGRVVVRAAWGAGSAADSAEAKSDQAWTDACLGARQTCAHSTGRESLQNPVCSFLHFSSHKFFSYFILDRKAVEPWWYLVDLA